MKHFLICWSLRWCTRVRHMKMFLIFCIYANEANNVSVKKRNNMSFIKVDFWFPYEEWFTFLFVESLVVRCVSCVLCMLLLCCLLNLPAEMKLWLFLSSVHNVTTVAHVLQSGSNSLSFYMNSTARNIGQLLKKININSPAPEEIISRAFYLTCKRKQKEVIMCLKVKGHSSFVFF